MIYMYNIYIYIHIIRHYDMIGIYLIYIWVRLEPCAMGFTHFLIMFPGRTQDTKGYETLQASTMLGALEYPQ